MNLKSTADTHSLDGDDGDQLDQLLDERAFSRKVNRSVSSLRKDRMFGRGFPYIKLGKLVRYSPRDARKEIDRCRRTSTTDTGAAA